jgi:hypothetical protein
MDYDNYVVSEKAKGTVYDFASTMDGMVLWNDAKSSGEFDFSGALITKIYDKSSANTSSTAYVMTTSSGGLAPYISYQMEGNLTNLGNGGSSLNGTIVGTASYNSSVFKRGTQSLLSNTSSNISIPTMALNGTGGLTIAFWFYRTAPGTETFLFFNNIMKVYSFGGTSTYNMYFEMVGSSSNLFYTFTSINVWNHFAVTLTYSTGSTSTHKVYADGVLRSTLSNVQYPTTTYTNNVLGQCTGYMDDFRIYNSVLSDSDITTVYNSDITTSTFTNIVYSRRLTENVFNGYPAIQLANSGFTSPVLPAYVGATFSFFLVAEFNDLTASPRILSFGPGTVSNDASLNTAFILTGDSTSLSIIRNSVVFPVGAITLGVPYLVAGYFDGTNLYVGLNGVYTSYSSTGNFTIVSSGLGISNYINSTARHSTDYGELIVYTTAPTEDQRTKIEGQLAWKWGLAAALPLGHPYSAMSPYKKELGGFLPSYVPNTSFGPLVASSIPSRLRIIRWKLHRASESEMWPL